LRKPIFRNPIFIKAEKLEPIQAVDHRLSSRSPAPNIVAGPFVYLLSNPITPTMNHANHPTLFLLALTTLFLCCLLPAGASDTKIRAYQGRTIYEWDGRYLSQYQGRRIYEWDGRYVSQYQGRRIYEWDGCYLSQYQGSRLLEIDESGIRAYQGKRLFTWDGEHVSRYQGRRVLTVEGVVPQPVLALLVAGKL
jgi:hypothetical protein